MPETSDEAYKRIQKQREDRKNRNWFTKHEGVLILGTLGVGFLVHQFRQQTAEGSPAEVFLLIVGTLSAVFATLLATHAIVELGHTILESRELGKIVTREEDEENS